LKLLLDTCVSPRARAALVDAGCDAVWAGDWESDPGDDAILETAEREGRILVTLDKDFGELAVVFGRRHCGIVRLVDLDPRRQAAACKAVLARHGEELAAGAIATVTPDRVRVRPAEDVDEGGDDARRR
jgi:predicted nuclease of predicted toxin-antitoxin system